MATHGGPNIVDDGLVFYVDPANKDSWDGPDASLVNDLVSTNTGSIFNDTSGSYGLNNSFDFDGTDDYIDCCNIFSALDGLQKMTLSIWVKPTSPNTSRHIISIPWDTGYPNRNIFRLTIRNDNLLWFTVRTDSYRATETTQTLVFNQWNHIAAVVDTTQAQQVDRIKIYNNATFSKGSDNMNLNLTFNTSIGGIFIGENGSRSNYLSNFQGDMSCIMVYNRALSSQEVKQNFNALNRFGI